MTLPPATPSLDAWLPGDPVPRLIFAVDIEGSTERINRDKGGLRYFLYELLGQAFDDAEIASKHLESITDRGDSVLVLIKPHDEVPKTLVLGRLIPILTSLLTEHNASATRPELRMRLRAVVHAGEIHGDGKGFYGDDLDAAFRLLDASALKKALREAEDAPLILVVSEEIYNGIVQQGYLDESSYRPLVRVKVGRRLRRGWVHVPEPLTLDPHSATSLPGGQPPTNPMSTGPMNGHGLVPPQKSKPGATSAPSERVD